MRTGIDSCNQHIYTRTPQSVPFLYTAIDISQCTRIPVPHNLLKMLKYRGKLVKVAYRRAAGNDIRIILCIHILQCA